MHDVHVCTCISAGVRTGVGECGGEGNGGREKEKRLEREGRKNGGRVREMGGWGESKKKVHDVRTCTCSCDLFFFRRI